MIDISSHLKRSEFKMRVLIVSAFLAYAAAAPSGLIVPYVYQPAIISAVVPTISSGDIQAAAIDAQVKVNDAQVLLNDAQIQANDLARAAADSAQVLPNDAQVQLSDAQIQANDLARAAADNAQVQLNDAQVQANDLARAAADNAQGITDQAGIANEKAVADIEQINEKNLEAFWSNEEKKWQAIDAVKTAEAQIDGAAATNAELYAKTAIGGVVPYIAPVAPVARIAPIVYSPYFSAVNGIPTSIVQVKAEEKKEETAAVKSIEKPLVLTSNIISPYPNVWQYNGLPAVGPVVNQPFVRYAPFPAVQGPLGPAFVRNVW